VAVCPRNDMASNAAMAVLKVRCGGDIHRILIGPGYCFQAVQAEVARLLPNLPDGAMKYMDSDGDWCTLVESTFDDFVVTMLSSQRGVSGERPTLRLEVIGAAPQGGPTTTLQAPRPRCKAPRRRRRETQVVALRWAEDGRDLEKLVREVEDAPPSLEQEPEGIADESAAPALMQRGANAEAKRRRRPPKKQRHARDAASSVAEPVTAAMEGTDDGGCEHTVEPDDCIVAPTEETGSAAPARPIEEPECAPLPQVGGASAGAATVLARSWTWPGPLAAPAPPPPSMAKTTSQETDMSEAEMVEELCRILGGEKGGRSLPEAPSPLLWPPTPENTPPPSPRAGSSGSSACGWPQQTHQPQLVWVPVPILVPEWVHRLPIAAC